MIFKQVKKIVSPSLSYKISRQISIHKVSGFDFRKEIVCAISKDYSGPNISASLLSSNPDACGLSIYPQVWFFKKGVETIKEGFIQLTLEVSKAQLKFPHLIFYHMLTLLENDGIKYVAEKGKLSVSEKAEMVLHGTKFGHQKCHIYELYIAGWWHLTTRIPWQDSNDYEDFDTDNHDFNSSEI